jgi:hypothetical protein
MIITPLKTSPISSNNTETISPVDFTGITNYITLGDSIGFGSNATAGNSYRELLNTNYATTNTDLTASGRGTWNEIFNINTASFTRSSTVLWVGAGLNDLRRGSTILTYNKVVSSLKSVMKKAFAKSSVCAGSSSCVRVGSWTSADLTPYGGVCNTGVTGTASSSANSSIQNDTCSYTFTEDNVFVTFSSSAPSVSRGDCEIRIDGVLVETVIDINDRMDGINDGSYDNLRGVDTRFYSGLGAGSHTIEVKVISSGAGAVVIDQFGSLNSPANVGVVMVVQIPYITDYSKVGLDQANDSVIDSANELREDVVNYFKNLGYRIRFCKIMETNGGLYDLANIDSDGVHPTNAGHLEIYNSLVRYIG